LKSFVAACQTMGTVEDSLDSMLSGHDHESTLEFFERKRNWAKKKLAEVFHLSQFVQTISQENNCDLIVDIGSGLVRKL